MSKVEYNVAIVYNRGAQDSRKEGQAKRERLISRYRNGQAHQYPMQMHEGPWSEGATHNRELIKTAQKVAHAIEKAAQHPELSTPEYITLAAEWQQRFVEYKATKKPDERQFATLYTYTYSHLYRSLKAGEVLDIMAQHRKAKEELYQTIIPQIQSLISGEPDLIARMANVAAVLHNTFHFWWTGFYLVKGDELVLGPFQGPVACTRIPYNKGVCGTAWAQAKTLIVPDVHDFHGHIACSSESKSEIVIPVRHNGDIIAVLDIDSAEYNTFDSIDQKYLEQIQF